MWKRAPVSIPHPPQPSMPGTALQADSERIASPAAPNAEKQEAHRSTCLVIKVMNIVQSFDNLFDK